MMTISQEIINISNPTLLARVDRLRDLNIGQHVPLPQLVVVGDQSSGKSSLLVSLSGIPFLSDQSLCTRHATQITSRRDKKDYVDIRIIPGPHASDEHRKHVEGFHIEISSGAAFRDQEKFTDILKQANERMGLRSDLSTGSGAVFSEDVLKIEVHGPNEDYLTIIDVPGIFRTTTQGTTKEDMILVKDLVKKYTQNDRTIILAVLPSNVDIATQEILELAEEYDKNGERTLGVLTKPDLVLEPGAQAAVCELVQGKKRPLTLGYFLVRNFGANKDAMKKSELEQIFRQQPWCELPPERLGIAALREQLRELLVDITRREFPKLLQDVNIKIRECKSELSGLGPSRKDEREQRNFLSGIAGTFQDRVRAALAADYNADPYFGQAEHRLITHVVNITDVFNADFREGAHSRHFKSLKPARPPASEPDHPDCSETSAASMIENLRILLQEARVDEFTPDERAELGDLLVLHHWIILPQDGVTAWINDVYLRSRSLDLGTFNANMVSVAFTEQSRKWGNMTNIYMSRVIVTLHRFIAATLRSVCPDDQARRHLWSTILDSLVERYWKAVAQASILIEVEQHKQPYTLNQQFARVLSKARGCRLIDLLRPKARKDGTQYGEPQYMVNLDDVAKAAEGKNNMELLQEEIHDILHAYYSLALDRFIDNVFQLAVDHSLLHGPSSPLKVFTHEWVANLEAAHLEQIAGEAKSAGRKRSKLDQKIKDLSDALKILKEHK